MCVPVNKFNMREWSHVRPLEQLLFEEVNAHNEPIITACYTISGILSQEFIVQNIARRLAAHPRFCSRLESSQYSASYVPISNFADNDASLSEHVAFPPFNDFRTALEDILSSSLPKSRPLWKLFVFPGVTARNGERGDFTTVVFRVHHSVGDGIGLLKFFLACVVDDAPASAVRIPQQTKKSKRVHPSLQTSTARSKVGRICKAAVRPLRDVVAIFVQTMIPDQISVFTRATLQPRKKFAVATPIDLVTIRDSARSVGATINDLLYAALCGAARAYALEYGDDPDSLTRLHVGIPFNRHAAKEFRMEEVSNAVAVIPARFAVTVPDRVDRIRECRSILQELKYGSRPTLSLAAFALLDALPPRLRLLLWRRLTRVATALFTNLPGPTEKLTVGGRTVVDIQVFAPSQGEVGFAVSAISYCGKINVGLHCDGDRMQSPERFVQLFDEEVAGILQWTKEASKMDAEKV